MLPPVILMQRLDSSLDPTLVACELHLFLGLPRDLCEKSLFYMHFSLPWGPLQGPPYRGGRRGSHRAGSIAESHASKACLGLRLAPGLAWLAWVAGFGFDLV